MTADGGFYPFVRKLDPAERAARSRALAALARVYAGPAAIPLVHALRRLERTRKPRTRRWPCSMPCRHACGGTHSAPTPRFTQAATLPVDRTATPARRLRDQGRA